MTREGAVRLAEVVASRMSELGMMGPSDVYAAGGPAPTTMREILSGEQDKDFWPATLAKVDKALQWQTGSSARVAQGGEPTPTDAPSPANSTGVSIDLVIDPEVWAGMTPAQQQEARAAATVAILSKLREMGLA